MLILNVKLARHGECSSLVANETLRGYNIAKAPVSDGKIVCTEKDFDLTRAEFVFPIMVSREKAMEKYSLT